jgi:hypothetical protein
LDPAVIVALILLPWRVAVTVEEPENLNRALAAKLAEVAPAGKLSVAGTLNLELLLVTATVTPAAGAGAVKVVVQVLLLPETITVGVHCNPASETGEDTVKDPVFDVARLGAAFTGAPRAGGV